MRYLQICGILAALLTFNCALSADLNKQTRLEFRAMKNPWKDALERRGLLDYSVSNPYRFALPLTTLGSEDAKLMITYTNRMPGENGGKGMLLFAKIPLD